MDVNGLLSQFFASPTYRSTFAFLLKELFRLFRWRFLHILVLSFLAAAAQVGSIVLIINSVSALAAGGQFEMYGLSVEIEPSLDAVLALAAAPVVLIAVATVTMFKSRKQIALLMIDFHGHLDREVYRGVGALVRQPAGSDTRHMLDMMELTSMVGKDGRFAGRVINEVASSAVPVAAVAIILPILLYLDWMLFSVLAAIIFGSLVVYGRVGRQGANVSIAMEERGPAASRKKIGALKTILNSGLSEGDVDALASELRLSSDVKRFEEAYAARLTMPHLGNAVGSVFLAVTSFVVLVYFGWEILEGTWDQTEGVMFVLLFVYVLMSIRNLGKSLTNMNIFYPYLRRIVHFILNTQALSSSPVATISVDGAVSEELSERVGTGLGYVPSQKDVDYQLFREELAAGFILTAGFAPETAERFLGGLEVVPVVLDPWVGWLYTRSLDRPLTEAELELVEDAALAPIGQFLEDMHERGYDEDAWLGMSDGCRAALVLLSLCRQKHAVVALPVNFLVNLSETPRERLLNELSGFTIVYAQKNTSTFATAGIAKVVNFGHEDGPVVEPPGNKPHLGKQRKRKQKPKPEQDSEDDFLAGELY